MVKTLQLITLSYSKAIFVFFFCVCFPIFQTSLVNRQTCANESDNDKTLFDCKYLTLSQ